MEGLKIVDHGSVVVVSDVKGFLFSFGPLPKFSFRLRLLINTLFTVSSLLPPILEPASGDCKINSGRIISLSCFRKQVVDQVLGTITYNVIQVYYPYLNLKWEDVFAI